LIVPTLVPVAGAAAAAEGAFGGPAGAGLLAAVLVWARAVRLKPNAVARAIRTNLLIIGIL
jgi:hypothetical protein